MGLAKTYQPSFHRLSQGLPTPLPWAWPTSPPSPSQGLQKEGRQGGLALARPMHALAVPRPTLVGSKACAGRYVWANRGKYVVKIDFWVIPRLVRGQAQIWLGSTNECLSVGLLSVSIAATLKIVPSQTNNPLLQRTMETANFG